MARRFTIGRDRTSDIAIADDSVSRTHAEIWLEDDGTLMLADRGSSNGTDLIRAGEASALSRTAVLPGDQVRFGAVTLTVKDLIDAIEAKSPGALTRPPQATPVQKPTPHPVTGPPPIPNHPQTPPPIAAQAPQQAQVPPPPLPKPIAAPPPPIPGGQPAPPPVAPAPPQRAAAPPPLPPIPASPQAPRHVAPPPPPPIPDHPPAFHPVTPPERAAGPPGGPLVRCECGAIKTQGQVCPACHR